MPVWEFEPGHTSAEFAVRHMMVTIVRGQFKNLKGRFHFDPHDPAGCSVEATIDAASFTTAEPDRDAHLRSADFLDVANHPTITFKSTSVVPAGTDRYTLTGDLTIKGITHPVTLQVIKYGEFNDPMMGHRIAYSAQGQINRKEFGLSFNMMLDGKVVVSDEIQIMIEGELVEQKEAAETASA